MKKTAKSTEKVLAKKPQISLIFFCIALVICTTSPSYAIRTALFSEEIRNRAAVWEDQDKIFGHESVSEQNRPVWVHAGDSIATAWANSSTLRERLAVAESSDIPQPGSVQDMFDHVPDPTLTWYAGSRNEMGLFQFLELSDKSPWVLVSTALAGAMLSQKELNPLKLPLEVAQAERAKIFTLSAGANDICQLSDPYTDASTHPDSNLDALKRHFTHARFFVQSIPDVRFYRSLILQKLDSLPDSIGKRRMQTYCLQVWDNVECPAISTSFQSVDLLRSRLMQSYINAGFTIVDPTPLLAGQDIFDIISGDCFHPSKIAQKAIADSFKAAIQGSPQTPRR